MAVQGASKCVKYLMFAFNAIFFLIGLGIIIAGALTLTTYSEYVEFTGNSGTAISIVLICVGVFIFLTGFFGCCGAVKENYCMLGTYAFIMVVLLIIEVAAGISGYVLRNDIEQLIDENMRDVMSTYNESEPARTLFDHMQESLECCGVDNFTDWFGYNTSAPDTVPLSCCVRGDGNIAPDCNVEDSLDIYPHSCFISLRNLLEENIAAIAGFAIAVAVIEIFGIIFACCLMRAIKGEYEVV